MKHEHKIEKIFFMTENKKYYFCYTLIFNITSKLHQNIKFKAYASWHSHPGKVATPSLGGSYSSIKEAKEFFYKNINFLPEEYFPHTPENTWLELTNNHELINFLKKEYDYSDK